MGSLPPFGAHGKGISYLGGRSGDYAEVILSLEAFETIALSVALRHSVTTDGTAAGVYFSLKELHRGPASIYGCPRS